MSYADLLREVKGNATTRKIVAWSLFTAIALDVIVVHSVFYDFILHLTKPTKGVPEKTAWVIIIYTLRLAIFSVCYSSLFLDKCSSLSFKKLLIFSKHFLLKTSLIFLSFIFGAGMLFFLLINVCSVFDPVFVAVFHAILAISILKLSCKKSSFWHKCHFVYLILLPSYLLACIAGGWSREIFHAALPQGFVSYYLFYYTMSAIVAVYLDISTVTTCFIATTVAARYRHYSEFASLLDKENR